MSKDEPTLDSAVREELGKIEPSTFRPGTLLYPCAARLKDGRAIKCVYFANAATFKGLFLYERPEAMPGINSISPDSVSAIETSPFRLPRGFADEIYRASDAGWGSRDFTLVFSWWCRRDYFIGGFVDFLYYPLGRGPSDVKDVLLYRRKRRARQVPETFWCVYPE
jgi:hypothetical protein